jgi:predicted amidophosphoribosyltransferase
MRCPNCNKEYSDSNQQFCELCGTELSKTEKISPKVSPPKTKVDKIIEDLGLKEIYKKIKDNLKNI